MLAVTTGSTVTAMSERHLTERSIPAQSLTSPVVSGDRKNIGGAAMRIPVQLTGSAAFTSSQH